MAVQISTGDALTELRKLPDASAHCCVTSPPYFGLRDYDVDGQIGHEGTPDDYVAKLVDVFREVRRVLRDDGTLWLNIGDSYCSSDKWGGGKNGNSGKHTVTKDGDVASWACRQKKPKIDGIKPKDLYGVPWMLAFALRSDGWWLRDEIVWHKPNPMPSSVTDRCTPSHEKVFLFAKSKRYFFDAEAIATPSNGHNGSSFVNGKTGGHHFGNVQSNKDRIEQNTSNCRNVWSIPTQPFPGAHYAVMPPRLAERCILAGTSEKGCCADCGAPYQRIVDKVRTRDGEPLEGSWQAGQANQKIGASGVGHWRDKTETSTIGWEPTCPCSGNVVAAFVLDPFGGAGTTGMVADRLQRNAILIELNPKNVDMARDRIKSDAPLLTEVG